MFFTRVLAIVLSAGLCVTAPAFAEPRLPRPEPRTTTAELPPAGWLKASIDRVRFDGAGERETTEPVQISTGPNGSVLGKVVMAGVLGVAGFLGGGYLGAKIEGPCDCDDPGFKGAIIGAPIGAAVGAIAGWKLGGLLSR